MRPPSPVSNTPNEIKEYTENLEVKTIIDNLKTDLKSKRLHISDVEDKHGNQYIDLVQKGGGVWGIALIGFTYVLEKAGIRFLRMAGTSAGAINTVLITAIGTKDQEKSESLLKILAQKNLFDFVDGHWLVRQGVKYLTRWKKPGSVIKNTLFAFVGIFVVSLILLSFNGLIANWIVQASFILCFILVFFGVLAAALVQILHNRFNQAGQGLNPGETFLIWMRQILKEIKAKNSTLGLNSGTELMTTGDLVLISENIKDLGLRVTDRCQRGIQRSNEFKGGFTVITSDMCTENKIELPLMKDLFSTMHPISKSISNPMDDAASLVRASMSIPLFFESFYVRNLNKSEADKWKTFFGIEQPLECRLVDGGVLSNFPIDIYFDPTIENIRYPTIGVNLFSSEETAPKNSSEWSLLDFLGKMFNSARSYYDKAYVLKNKLQKSNIANVDVGDISWLNFSLSQDDKVKLFLAGVTKADAFVREFLIDVDKSGNIDQEKCLDSTWETIKEERKIMREDILKSTLNKGS